MSGTPERLAYALNLLEAVATSGAVDRRQVSDVDWAAGLLRAELLRAAPPPAVITTSYNSQGAPPPQQTEPAEVWIVEGRDHHGNIVRLGAPHWTRQEAEDNAKYFHLIKNWPKDDVWFVPLYRRPPAMEPGQRIEGWAGMGRVSWEFAPNDGRFTPGPNSQRATLIIHGATGEGNDDR